MSSSVSHWQRLLISDRAVLHKIAPRRARSAADEVLNSLQPEVRVLDRHGGHQEPGKQNQVRFGHLLHDVQYAIESGDTNFAPEHTASQINSLVETLPAVPVACAVRLFPDHDRGMRSQIGVRTPTSRRWQRARNGMAPEQGL